MSPITLPCLLQIPAMSSIEPLGFLVLYLKTICLLAISFFQDRGLAGINFPSPWAMGSFEHRRQAFQPRGRGIFRFQINPFALKPARIIQRQGDGLLVVHGFKTRQQPRFHEHLKPIAHADDQFFLLRRIETSWSLSRYRNSFASTFPAEMSSP